MKRTLMPAAIVAAVPATGAQVASAAESLSVLHWWTSGGMQFMGDWAKGEFANANKKADVDYICAASPGTSNAFHLHSRLVRCARSFEECG